MAINLNEHGYQETRAATPGEFASLPAGGYVCIVVNAETVYNKKGKLMLVLHLEINEGEFKGYFGAATKRSQAFNPQKRWDSGGIYRQNIFTDDNKVVPFFKGLLTMLTNDNPKLKINFDAFDVECLTATTLGFVFAEEEYDFNGYSGVHVIPKFPKSIEDIRNGNFKVPELKSKPVQDSTPKKDYDDLGGTHLSAEDTPF